MPKEDTQWKPGQSGNPNGRPPKAWTMSSLIEEALEEVEEKTGKSFKSLVAKRLAHMAVGGDIQAIKEINNRMDGKPVQRQILAGDEENPIRIDSSGILEKVYGSVKSSSPPQLHTDSEKS